jgi:hypothetical protein
MSIHDSLGWTRKDRIRDRLKLAEIICPNYLFDEFNNPWYRCYSKRGTRQSQSLRATTLIFIPEEEGMETKKPGGRGSSGPVLQRLLSFSFLFGLFLHGTVGIASADATLTVKLPKLPGAANPVLISVRAVEAETAQLLASISLKKKSSQVQLKVKALPQIVFGDLFTSDGNHSRSQRDNEGR